MSSDVFVCNVCNLDYSTKSQFEEHHWSLIHHKQLEIKFGDMKMHVCCLCSDSSDNLSSYAKHLISQKHRTALEVRNKRKQLQGSLAASSRGRQQPARLPRSFSEQPRPLIPPRFFAPVPSGGQNHFRGTVQWTQRFSRFTCWEEGNIGGTGISNSSYHSSYQKCNYNNRNSNSFNSSNRQWTPKSDFEGPQKIAGPGAGAGTFSSNSLRAIGGQTKDGKPHGPRVISRAVVDSRSSKPAGSSGQPSNSLDLDKTPKIQDQSKSSTSGNKDDVPPADVTKDAKKNYSGKQATILSCPLLKNKSTQDKTLSVQNKAKSSTSKDKDDLSPAVMTREANANLRKPATTAGRSKQETKLTPDQTRKVRDNPKSSIQEDKDGPSSGVITREVTKGDLRKPTTCTGRSKQETKLTPDQTPKVRDKTKSSIQQDKDGPSPCVITREGDLRKPTSCTGRSKQETKLTPDQTPKVRDKTKSCTSQNKDDPCQTASAANVSDQLEKSSNWCELNLTEKSKAVTTSSSRTRLLVGQLSEKHTNPKQTASEGPVADTARCTSGPLAASEQKNSSALTKNPPLVTYRLLTPSATEVTQNTSLSRLPCISTVTQPVNNSSPSVTLQRSVALPGTSSMKTCPPEVTRLNLPSGKGATSHQSPNIHPQTPGSNSNSPDCLDQDASVTRVQLPPSLQRELTKLLVKSQAPGPRPNLATARSRLHAGEHHQPQVVDSPDRMVQQLLMKLLDSPKSKDRQVQQIEELQHLVQASKKGGERARFCTQQEVSLDFLEPLLQSGYLRPLLPDDGDPTGSAQVPGHPTPPITSCEHTMSKDDQHVMDSKEAVHALLNLPPANQEQSVSDSLTENAESKPLIAALDTALGHPSCSLIPKQEAPAGDNRSTCDMPMIRVKLEDKEQSAVSATDIRIKTEPGISMDDISHPAEVPHLPASTTDQQVQQSMQNSDRRNSEGDATSATIQTHNHQSSLCVRPLPSEDTFTNRVRAEAKTSPTARADHGVLSPVSPESRTPASPVQSAMSPPPSTMTTMTTPTTPSRRRTPSHGKQQSPVLLQEVLLELSLQEELLHQKQANLDNRLKTTKALIQKKQLQFKNLKDQRNKISMEVLGIRTRRLQLLTDATLQSIPPSAMLPALDPSPQTEQVFHATSHAGTPFTPSTSASATSALLAFANASAIAGTSNRTGTPFSARTSTSLHNLDTADTPTSARTSATAGASNRGTSTSSSTSTASTSVHNSARVSTSTHPTTSISASLLWGKPTVLVSNGRYLNSQSRGLSGTGKPAKQASMAESAEDVCVDSKSGIISQQPDFKNVPASSSSITVRKDCEPNISDNAPKTKTAKTAKVPKGKTSTSKSGSESDVVLLEADSSNILEKQDSKEASSGKFTTSGKRKLQPSSSAITVATKKAKMTKSRKKKTSNSKSTADSKETSRGKSSPSGKRKLSPSSFDITLATKKTKTTQAPKKKTPNSKSAAGKKKTPTKAHPKSSKEAAVSSSLKLTAGTSTPGQSGKADGLIGMKLRPSTLTSSVPYKEFIISSDSDSDDLCKPDSSTRCATQSQPSTGATPSVPRRTRSRSLIFPNHDSAVLGMSLANETLYTVAADGTARVYNIKDRTCKKVLRDHRDEVTSLVMWTDPGKDSYLCTGSYDHTINVYNMKTLKIERKFICEAKVTCLVVRSPLLYAAMVNGIIHVFDLKEREKVKSFHGKGSCRIECMVSLTSNKIKLLGIGYEDWTIGIHSTIDGRLLVSLHGHNGSILCMTICKQFLYSGSVDKTLMVHNHKTGRHIKTIYGHRHSVTGVNIVQGLILTSCLDGKVRVFCHDAKDYILIKVVASFPQMIRSMACYKTYIYMGFTDGTVQAVRLPKWKRLWRDRKKKNLCQWVGCGYQGSHAMLYNHAKEFHQMTDNQCRWGACLQKFTGPDQTKLKDEHIRMHLDKLFQHTNQVVSVKLRARSKWLEYRRLETRNAPKANQKTNKSSEVSSSTTKRKINLVLG